MQLLFCLICIGIHFTTTKAFSVGDSQTTIGGSSSTSRFNEFTLKCYDDERNVDTNLHQRRRFLSEVVSSSASLSGLFLISNANPAVAKSSEIDSLLTQLKEARAQLEPVPALIKEEKWDSVRAVLITPPLADCWAKTSKPLLKLYAQAQDDLPNGDELAALELREEALDHLRFLDMAVYNNVFNPIKSEGETGATKELIRSYYEDPINEYKQCVRILDDLITLGN